MKLSGNSKAIFLLAALLPTLPTIHAQQSDSPQSGSDPVSVDGGTADPSQVEAPGTVRLLYFERPVALARAEEKALNLTDIGTASIDSSAEPSVFADLAPEQQAYLQRLADIDGYEQLLEQVEYEGGAWSAQIAEELITLGTLLQAQGDYQKSTEVFDRAVLVNRVNFGLYSPEQIPLVERIVDNHLALGQWSEADKQQQYAFYVQVKAYGTRDPRMASVYEDLARWNITSFYRGVDDDPTARLLETYRLFRAAASVVAFHFGTEDPRYVNLLKDVAGASDMVTRFSPAGTLEATPTNPNIRRVSEFIGVSVDPVRVPGGGGESALRRIVDFYGDSDRPATEENLMRLVQALAEVGDWYMMEQRRQAAVDVYSEAWDLLLALEDGAARAQGYFDQVVFLPTFSRFDEEQREAFQVSPDYNARQGYVEISFDVSQYGRPSDFTVLGIEPLGMERVDMMAVNHVRSMTLRPKFQADKALASSAERFRVPFWYREVKPTSVTAKE